MINQKFQYVYGADKKKTPQNLQYLINDNISNEEFFNSCGEFSNEKQLPWWSYDLIFGRKKSDFAKTLEKQKKLLKKSNEEKTAIEEKNSLYLKKLKKRYLESEEQLKIKKDALDYKIKELENLKIINELKQEKEIIELEEDFQREAKEHAEAILSIEEEKKFMLLQTELNNQATLNAQLIEKKIAEHEKLLKKMDTELINAVKGESNPQELLLKAKLTAKEKAEKSLNEKEDEIAYLELKKKELAGITQAVIYDGDFLPRVNKYEAYNAENILEIKDLSLRNKETGERVISDFNLDLKFLNTCAVYSESPKKLLLLLEGIKRSFDLQYIISKGEIRIEGVNTIAVNRKDFKTRFSNTLLNINEVYFLLNSCGKTVKGAVKRFAADTDTVYNYLKLMNEDINKDKNYNKKISSFSVDFIVKLAVAVSLAIKLPLLFISFYDMPISNLCTLEIIQFINTSKRESALMVFSTDKKMLLKLKDTKIYNLK